MTPDLTTTYLGLQLRSPILASSSPLTGKIDSLLELEHHGIGAAVLPSIFEEQIEHEEPDVHELLEQSRRTASVRRSHGSPSSRTTRPAQTSISSTSRRRRRRSTYP